MLKVKASDDSNPGQIKKLREAMFDQIKRLNDPNVDLEKELKRAHAITYVGTVIVNSVKVEIDFHRVANSGNGKQKDKLLDNEKKASQIEKILIRRQMSKISTSDIASMINKSIDMVDR